MKLLQLPPSDLRHQLAGNGVWLRTGPFSLRIRSRLPRVAEGLAELYGQFEVRSAHQAFADFHVEHLWPKIADFPLNSRRSGKGPPERGSQVTASTFNRHPAGARKRATVSNEAERLRAPTTPLARSTGAPARDNAQRPP